MKGPSRLAARGLTVSQHQAIWKPRLSCETHRRPQVVLDLVRDTAGPHAIYGTHVTEEHAPKDGVPQDLPGFEQRPRENTQYAARRR